jgi:hypothetical protein
LVLKNKSSRSSKKIISHVFAHQEYQESRYKVGNLPFSAWIGAWVMFSTMIPSDSQKFLGNGTREVETHVRNMWKYVETAGFFF